MKHKLFKIWLLLVLLSLANMPCSIFAQSNTQYEITGVSSKGSIIVAYKNNVEIVYNNGNTKAFFYVDRNTLTSSEAMVSNLDEVSDMEFPNIQP